MTTEIPEQTAPARERLTLSPARVLATLPAMGKLMITANHLGATHERIGVVETAVERDGFMLQGGEAHESRIELSRIADMIVDRSGIMGDKVYPRIDFYTADGETLFSVVGFDGLTPFDAALAPLGRGEPVEPKPDEPRAPRGEVGENDPGTGPFEAALADGGEVVVGFRKPGFEQAWRGRIEAVKPAMGFINVMRPDFHLHLKAGAVATWRAVGDEQQAETADAVPLGLFIAKRS